MADLWRPGRAMGFGLPTAIGAALANPERTVVCFSGDGSIFDESQEFATLAEAGLNVKVVLMNNASLGLVHQQQGLFYGERIASPAAPPAGLPANHRGFRIAELDLDAAADPRAALDGAECAARA